ncbi:hypothetical protein M885DRAFT_17461 [Pelagophyceae sp. CCMP2097]|nr:hypothetical protein M885DRAFT_17461 [Pelagophyceae sp. CCMP2097]
MVEAWNDVGVACHACAASDDATEAFEYALELAEEAAAAEAAEAVAVDNVIAVDTKSDLASVPLRNLALHLLSAGDLRRAVPLLRRVLEATALKHNPAGFVPVDETFGAGDDLQVDEAAMAQSDPSRIESLVVVDPLVALGYALLLDCDFDGSTRVYARALRIVRTHLGPDAAENVRLLEFLALVAFSSGHFDRAEELFRRTLKVLDGLGRSNIDVDVKRTIANMAQARVRRGKRGPTKPDKRLFAMPIPALFSQTASLSSQTAGSAHGEGLVASASLSALRGAAPR